MYAVVMAQQGQRRRQVGTLLMDKQVWFVAEDRKGFTDQPEYALKTRQGWPVVCPGEVRRIESSVLDRIQQLWEHLLDQMEKLYELEEEDSGNGYPEDPRDAFAQENIISTLIDALAILEYGWTFEHEPEQARTLVKRQAKFRYERSTE